MRPTPVTTRDQDIPTVIIIMVIFKCYLSGEHIALSLRKNNDNGVNI